MGRTGQRWTLVLDNQRFLPLGVQEPGAHRPEDLEEDRRLEPSSCSPASWRSEGRLRIDDWEMWEDIQAEVERRWLLQRAGEPIGEGDLEG
ncbi:MAG TPA: hypothetical protein PLW59_06620 [Sphaerochaeta sp.]|nr:hypothetical protein [Sphaerochaeta sp.]